MIKLSENFGFNMIFKQAEVVDIMPSTPSAQR